MVFTFGRFNPPTTGHHLLANKVKAEAKKRSADYKIYGSSSQDKNKNPLSATDKYRFMKKILKGFNVSVDRNAKTPFVVLQKLSDEGYDEVTMVVGADRVSEFKKQISRYVGPDKDFKFSKFEVVSAGERDPDAEGVVGMSASKMRAAAKEGNFTAFRLGIPKHVSKNDAMGLFNAVRKGMGVRGKINESSWFDYDEYQEFANELNERKLTDKEKKSKQEIGDSLPDSEFRRKYSPPPRGPAKNWKEVKWATATKIAKGEGRGKKNEEMDLNEKWLQNLLRWNRARNLQAGQSQKASRLRKELQSKMSERGRVSREQDDAPLFGNRIATKVGKLSRGEDRLLSQVQRAERSAYRLGRIKAGKKPFGDDEIMKATKDNPTQGELDFVTDKKKRGMAEGLEQLDELSIQARRKLARRMKRTAKRRARVRKRKEKRRRTKTQLTAKAKKQAVMKVRQKLLRGMKWQDVPYLQREKIDAKVKKKKKRIAQIAKRLMPAMQKAEKERLDKVRKRMTTNDPAKAMSNNVNENFEQLINEVAPKYAMAQQRLIAKERDRGTGASTPQERDAARKRGTREAQQQGGKPKWSDLMMVTDTRDKVKLILAKDFDQSKHSVKVRKGKVTRGIAGTAANSPGWEWTETAKKLIKRKEDQPTQTAQPKVAMPKTPGSAGGAAGAGQQRPPMTPQEKQTAQANADLASLNAQEKEIQVGQLQKQVADEQEAEEQQKAAEAQKAEDDAMRQRQAALTKSSRDLLYPDSEHKAVDLEAGVVLALNQKNGVDPSAGLVSEKDQQLYQDSLTLNPAATRIIDQISEQLGPEYEAIHFGRATEPISGMWADYGGTDNTPKTDLMFKNRETGEVMRVSMKSGDGQLMSAKKGEAMATMKSIMQAHGDKIRAEKGTEKKINAIMKKMEKFVTTAETGMGAGPVGQFLKGKAKEGENPAVLLAEEMHQDVTDDFRDLLESSTAFKRALTRESMTGELKFGGCCPPDPNAVASATHMLSTKKDGTGAKLIPIDDDYVDNVAAGAKPKVAFKSSQKVASEGGKKVKTGSYSYWTAMRLLTSAAAFAGDAMQSGAQAMMESLLGMKDFIDLNEETKMNGREYLRKAKEWIGKDPEKMKEFLGIETESIETAEQDLSDLNTWESGQHTDIIINGKRKRLPVQKDLEYFDLEKEMTPLRGDMNEDFRLLTEPDVLDNLVNSLKKRGMENDKAYAIATSSLQKRGILKPGTHELAEYTATTPWQNQPAPAGALQKGLDWFTTSSWSPGTWLPDSWKKQYKVYLQLVIIGDNMTGLNGLFRETSNPVRINGSKASKITPTLQQELRDLRVNRELKVQVITINGRIEERVYLNFNPET